jgi:hypothetical protein
MADLLRYSLAGETPPDIGVLEAVLEIATAPSRIVRAI